MEPPQTGRLFCGQPTLAKPFNAMQAKFNGQESSLPIDPVRRAVVCSSLVVASGCATTLRSPDETAEWGSFAIPGKRLTIYARTFHDGRAAWHAQADTSASLWRRRMRAAVATDSEVEFSWWVPHLLPAADLSRADAADSPVRLVLAFEGDVSRLSMRHRLQYQTAETLTGEAPPYATLMYVWDNRAEVESILPGARSDRVRKIVIERGERNLRRWISYRRSLWGDFQRTFGEPPGALVGIALFTDTDNTRSTAEAWYGDVVVRP
jgi:hypothetical protein